MGTLVILEVRRVPGLRGMVYASSSSVYGANTKQPFSVGDPVDYPVSLYGATKRSCELMAESYSPALWAAVDGIAVFHSVWAMGPPGYGSVSVHARDPGGRTDSGLQ